MRVQWQASKNVASTLIGPGSGPTDPTVQTPARPEPSGRVSEFLGRRDFDSTDASQSPVWSCMPVITDQFSLG